MLKNRILGLFLLAAFMFCTTALLAQAKPQDKKAQDKKGVEFVEPVKVDKPKGKEKIMIYNGEYLKVQLYGFVKMDMVYNTRDVFNESGPFRVENQVVYYNLGTAIPAALTPLIAAQTAIGQPVVSLKKTMDQRRGSFVIDVRTSRLGFNIMGPKVLGADTKANIEIDFWGGSAVSGSGARQGIPMLRHGYAQLDWKTDLYSAYLVFGQTWGVAMAMPAQPVTLTYVPFGENGNIFIREPMIWFGQKIGNNVFNVTLDLAAARVLSGADTGTAFNPSTTAGNIYPGINGTQPDDRGPGEASQLPGGRARIYFVLKPSEIFAITLGGSALYQWERHGLTFANLTNTYIWGSPAPLPSAALFVQRYAKMTRSYAAQGFGKIEISLVTLVGTYWRGVNMDSFTCGLGQGTVENFTATKVLGVKMQGGYGQVQFDLRKVGPIPILLIAGYGGSMKNNTRNIAKGNMLWNETIQGAIQWYLNDYIWAGFEYARHQTKWKGDLGSAIDNRYHTSVMFSF